MIIYKKIGIYIKLFIELYNLSSFLIKVTLFYGDRESTAILALTLDRPRRGPQK